MHDWVRFYRSDTYQSLISYSGPRETAMAKAAEGAGHGLILTDPCVNPQSLKIVSGARDVYMNFGMAWPEKYNQVLSLEASTANNTLDIRTAVDTGVGFVMTDSACAADWATTHQSSLVRVDSADYRSGAATEQITLWRLEP
jgi:hypothetical protein